MPLTDNTPELNQPARPNQPLFERVQDWIFRMDSGFGIQWLRLGLFVLFVGAVILFYAGTQFHGLRDPETMDLGQLGRNLANGRGYVTRNVRIVDLSYLSNIGKAPLGEGRETVPELWTPPMYPFMLSILFRMFPPHPDLSKAQEQLNIKPGELPPQGDVQRLQAYLDSGLDAATRMDRLPLVMSWTFFLVGIVVLYLLARELFDARVANLSIFLYVLSDPLLDACVSGSMLPFLTVMFMLTAYALLKAKQWSETKSSIYWPCGALLACGFFLGIGTLSRYTFACLLLPLVIYLFVAMPKMQVAMKLGLTLGMFFLVLMPWVIRNQKVSNTFFGLSKFTVTEIPYSDLTEEVAETQVQRGFDINSKFPFHQVGVRALTNWDNFYRKAFKESGANYLIAFFLVSLFHRFRREDVLKIHWFVFWGMVAALVWIGFSGMTGKSFFTMFSPLIYIYGAAFFFVMFERLQFRLRLIRRAIVGLFVLVNIMPMIFTSLPPAPLAPYPPYHGGVIATTCDTFRDDELLASDVPWAVAWYGDRSAVIMPWSEEDYVKINDHMHFISGIYMTQQTLLELKVGQIVKGYQQYWLTKYDPRMKPKDMYFRTLTKDGEQILLSNRQR